MRAIPLLPRPVIRSTSLGVRDLASFAQRATPCVMFAGAGRASGAGSRLLSGNYCGRAIPAVGRPRTGTLSYALCPRPAKPQPAWVAKSADGSQFRNDALHRQAPSASADGGSGPCLTQTQSQNWASNLHRRQRRSLTLRRRREAIIAATRHFIEQWRLMRWGKLLRHRGLRARSAYAGVTNR